MNIKLIVSLLVSSCIIQIWTQCAAYATNTNTVESVISLIDSGFEKSRELLPCQLQESESCSLTYSQQTRLSELENNKISVESGSVLVQTKLPFHLLTKNATLRIAAGSAVLVNASNERETVYCLYCSKPVNVSFRNHAISLIDSEAVHLTKRRVSPSELFDGNACAVYGHLISQGIHASVGHFGLVSLMLDEPVLGFAWLSKTTVLEGFKERVAKEQLRIDNNSELFLDRLRKFKSQYPRSNEPL